MAYHFTAPCLFGLESILADEIRFLGLTVELVEDGRVHFLGELSDIARCSLWLRTAERVLLKLADGVVKSFEELFVLTKSVPWADYLPKDAQFPVNGHALKSQLHSVPDCQKIVKKAVVSTLSEAYSLSWLPEDGVRYSIRFALYKDHCSIYLDASGSGLYKRGYRLQSVTAPLRETLSAALVNLARYRGNTPFLDPFCGSGTIAIEAVMRARNMAPGLQRTFDAEKWHFIDTADWAQEVYAAHTAKKELSSPVFASDLDPEALVIAKENAHRAGVLDNIQFSLRNALDIDYSAEKGVLVTNPPYGERLLDRNSARTIYKALGKKLRNDKVLQAHIITSEPEFERFFDRPAAKRRKLYNGMIQCTLFSYFAK